MKQNKVYYTLLIAGVAFLMNSCSKGDMIIEPRYGFVSFVSSPEILFKVVLGENQKPIDGVANVVAGKNRIRCYQNEILQLDTMIMAEANLMHSYVLFKPNNDARLSIYDKGFKGVDKEILPDSGFIKISLANFSTQFPGKVNMYVTTTTFIDFRSQEIQIAEFLNTSASFPDFKTIQLGATVNNTYEHKLKLTLKSPETGAVLTSVDFVLPTGAGKGSKNLPYTVYLVYISGSGNAEILMNK